METIISLSRNSTTRNSTRMFRLTAVASLKLQTVYAAHALWTSSWKFNSWLHLYLEIRTSLTKKKKDTGCTINKFVKRKQNWFNILYRSHLEHVYRLCRMCDKYVKAKLSQDERRYKPSLLAWKLELSKKHFRTAKTVVQSFLSTVSFNYFNFIFVTDSKYLQKQSSLPHSHRVPVHVVKFNSALEPFLRFNKQWRLSTRILDFFFLRYELDS